MTYYRNVPITLDEQCYGSFDPVTTADKEAEKIIRFLINRRYPSHGIIGEEFGGENENNEYVWIIDPIDGTKAFISGMPTWGILIALLKDDKPVLGINNQPALKEVFIGDDFIIKRLDSFGSKVLKTRKC